MNLYLPWRSWVQALCDWIESRTWRLGPVEKRLHAILRREHDWLGTVHLHELYEAQYGFLSIGALYVALGKLEHYHLASYDYRNHVTGTGYRRTARYYVSSGRWDD